MFSAFFLEEKFPNLTDDESLQKWNSFFSSCVNPNIFSIYEWGKYKENNWKVERILFYNKETFVGMTQILFKSIGPLKFGWCSSGINLTNYKYLPEIIEALKSKYDFKKTVIRFNFLDPATGEIQFEFDGIEALKAVPVSVNSGYTIRYNLDENPPKIPADFSKNNRYYLKQSKENLFNFSVSSLDPKEYVSIHNQMVENKGLANLAVTEESIALLLRVYGEKIKMIKVYKDEKCYSAALIIMVNKIAYYYLAGSTEEGREKSASFFMIEQLLQYLTENKFTEFDFGGITPFKESAKGVNRFKLGFGGKVIHYVGERNLCDNPVLSWFFNLIIVKKLG